jgi:hypothetical protein
MIELNKKRKKVLYGFAVVYAVMFLALGWLFFLSPSIELMEETIGGGKKVYLVNTSSHIINNAEVYYFLNEEKKILQTIESINPQESIELNLSNFQGYSSVELIAEAPFHNSFKKTILLTGISSELSYRIRAPSSNFVGSPVEIVLVIENRGNSAEELNVSETHDTEALEASNGMKSISVSENGSAEVLFLFTPLKSGETEIIFNVETSNNTVEQLSHEIYILGESNG